MHKLDHWFLSLSTRRIAAILISIDILLSVIALWSAFSLRLGEAYTPSGNQWVLFVLCPIFAVPIFIRLGLYHAIIRYIGGQVLWVIFQAVTCSAVIFSLLAYLFIDNVANTVPIIYWLILMLFVGGSRFTARWLLADAYARLGGDVAKDCYSKKVIIYGAGNAGIQLASALNFTQDMKPVAFIDDDKGLHRRKVNGLRIYPMTSLSYLIDRHDVADLLLAIPSTTRSRRNEVIRLLEPYPVHVRTVPRMTDIAQGKIKFDELQEVDIADLLTRDSVSPNHALLHANITDKVVMVTGAGGTIGSELCRQIITLQPKKIILFELNEFALYSTQKELNHTLSHLDTPQPIEVLALLGSVVDEERVDKICRTLHVQTIYHAAAYKHVPLVEQNPCEAVKNNIFGTLTIAQAAVKNKVETFVLISTDKAVRPTNTMGATKRFAELVLQGLSLESNHKTRFTLVRFGNVLGSSGSVIPLFREQIARGGPVTVTDARILRYFMTITEAAQLVIQAGAMGKGGDVFVLDMGAPIRILDLAKKMIHLSGLEVKDDAHPGGEIEITYTGLRPGEKLFEELLIGNKISETAHCRIMRSDEDIMPLSEINEKILQLQSAIKQDDLILVRSILQESITGFIPQCEVSDLLFKAEALNPPPQKPLMLISKIR